MSAVLSLLLLAAAPSPDASGIRWIHDDWEAAKKAALAAKKPIAVDVWATWCHTCLSMKSYVLTQPAMAKVKGDVVWLALDFDLPKNAAFFEQYPVNAFPTFMVLDPKGSAVLGRWMGSGTAEEMARFFGDSAKGGDQALAEAQKALARQDYAKALDVAQKGLARPDLIGEVRTRLAISWVEAAWKINPKMCATEGVTKINDVEPTAQGLDFVMMVADCASELPKDEQKKVLSAVRGRLEKVADDEMLGLSTDDRSGVYAVLADTLETLGDKAGAERAQEKRLAILEAAAKAAPSPIARATFDDHRLQAYTRLGRWADAEAMLSASEKDLPKDFNPPGRLAVAYLKQKKVDQGLAAIERALSNGYGARKLRLYTTKIDLLIEAQKIPEAQRTLATARAELAKLPKSVIRPSWVEELESRAKKIEPQG